MAWARYLQRASRWVWALACAAVLLDALHAASGLRLGLPEAAWVTWVPVSGIGSGAVAALLAAVGGDRASRLTRILLGAGMACYAPGIALMTLIVSHQASDVFPTIADFCWIGFYPLALAAIVVIFRRSHAGRSPILLADAGVGALSALAIGSLMLGKLVLAAGAFDSDAIGSTVYSLGDLLLVGVSVGTFAVFGWRPPRALVILTVGLLLQAVEDGIYLRYIVADTFPTDGWVIVLWLTDFAIISAAAVFPRLHLEHGTEERSRTTTIATSTFGVVMVVVATLIMVDPHPWAVSIGVGGAGLLMVVGRMGLAMWNNLRLLGEARDDSRTDPLTNLGNRRDLQLMAEFELAARGGHWDQLTLAIYDLDGFKSYNDSYGHPAGDALLRRLSTRLRASVPSPARAFRLGGDEFCVLIPQRTGDAEAIVAACHAALSESGEAFYVTNSYGVATLPQDAANLTELLTRADRRLYAMKMNRPLRGQGNSVALLRRVLEESQPDVRSHQTEVARLALRTGRALGLSEAALVVLANAAEFHDVGKIAIPDSILKKAGPLDDEEWSYMRRHTLIGERFLIAVPGMERVARIVRSTHERVDGTGYPDGLSAEAIPLEARIIAVCDAYDAMRTDRPYRVSCSAEDALQELRRCAGSQFDASVLDAFEQALDGGLAAQLEPVAVFGGGPGRMGATR